MTFFDSKGRKKTIKSPSKYLIDWDGKSLSKFQKAAKDFLRPYWKFDYVFEEFPMIGSKNRFDIYNATKRVVVELMGKQHEKFVPFFQKNRANFLRQVKRDLDKHEFCKRNNIILVEFTEKEFYNKTDEEIKDIFLSQGVII